MGTSMAAHEAGHAVAAVVLQLSLRYVTLRPRGGEAGVAYTRDPQNETPGYLGRSAVCAYAGIAGDELLNGRVIFGSDVDDVRRAREIAARLGVVDVSEFLLAKRSAAREVLRANRRAVKEVEVALVERRTLSSAEVREVVLGSRRTTG
jgi:ATP-dependent Zn protease